MSGDQMGSEPPRVAAGDAPKTEGRIGSFSRLLSGLDAGGVLRDVEPEKMKDEIRRWAKSVVSLMKDHFIYNSPGFWRWKKYCKSVSMLP
ncbi:hypothetical protein OsJ_19398 [Oryza sativa Japonica Group]|uniref:Uncharacterized protein n=2 Tax=Oryza TaxID=4527 RepID=B9FHJ9_ORYSJ|nr:hypothetical protein OsJ_19398 [Oryza sativa Japonica Group]